MTFQFRLSTVLRVRDHERSVHRQSVAIARADHAYRIEVHNRIAGARDAILNELREINDSDSWQIEKVANRQRHAEQLNRELEIADAAVHKSKNHLEQCLKSLVLANQSVQILERLEERQLADFESRQTKAELREFDDCINASRRAG